MCAYIILVLVDLSLHALVCTKHDLDRFGDRHYIHLSS